jgi:hypothetical protein
MRLPRVRFVLVPVALSLFLASPASAATDRFVDQETGVDIGTCTSTNPCDSIFFALSVAGTGDTIKVDDSAASYDGTHDVVNGASILGSEFVGGDEGDVVLDGGSAPAVRVQSGQSAGTISGLTLHSTNIALRLSDSTAAVTGNRFDSGGNFQTDVVIEAGSPTISQNLFTDASVTLRDIGISVDAASPTIIDNEFVNLNVAVEGGQTTAASNTRIEENEITGVHPSSQNGFGINFARSTGLVIEDNEISAPAAAGMNGIFIGGLGGTAAATLRRNQVYDFGNGIFFDNTSFASLNGDVIGGSTQLGLGASDPGVPGDGDVTAKNVTIISAAGSNDEIQLNSTQLTLDSSIVGDEGVNTGATDANCVITRSRGHSTTPGIDGCGGFQTTVAPAFVNAAGDDYHLTAANPLLIDQGDPAVPSAPDNLDYDLEKRNVDGNADCTEVRDIGADEFLPAPPAAAITSGPANGSTITISTTQFAFTNTNTCPGATFECSLDGAAFASCGSPATVGPLGEGSHTFAVRALDLVPQAGAAQSRTFTVDLPAVAGPNPECEALRKKLKKAKSKKKKRKIRKQLKKLGC